MFSLSLSLKLPKPLAASAALATKLKSSGPRAAPQRGERGPQTVMPEFEHPCIASSATNLGIPNTAVQLVRSLPRAIRGTAFGPLPHGCAELDHHQLIQSGRLMIDRPNLYRSGLAPLVLCCHLTCPDGGGMLRTVVHMTAGT